MDARSSSPEEMVAAAAGLISTDPIAAPAATTPIVTAAPVAAPIAAAPVAIPVSPGAPIVVNSPLGKQIYGAQPIDQVVLTSFADVQAFAKDFLGAEVKEVKDLVPIFTELKAAKEQAALAAQLQKTLDNYTSTINNLPKDVSLIFNAAIQGVDHRPIINQMQRAAVMDYTKTFEQHDPLALVNHYVGNYSKETFDALEETAKRALTDSVRLKYTADSNEIKNFEANAQRSTKEAQDKFLASVESSITNFVTANPGVDKAAVDRVRQIMQYGIADSLFTKEKTYAPDAAEKIAMMEFGKQTIAAQAHTIGDIVAKLTAQGVTKEIERTLMRSDRPVIAGGAKDSNVLSAIVEQETSFLKK
jgi:hypothetical protein